MANQKRSTLLVLGYFAFAGVMVAVAPLFPPQHGQVAVIQGPWNTVPAEAVIARAGGSILSSSGNGRIAITQSTDQDFIRRLYDEGAGFVSSALAAQACIRLIGITGKTDR
ncbi:hypothetical protein [Roseibium sediminis]|uniref:hypothetical protein n=1 Tax=Roseibium sediminis TaxID=1775174 RepID=UPI00123E2DC1|nr:hypothetical protein [Roseibium sediminis]